MSISQHPLITHHKHLKFKKKKFTNLLNIFPLIVTFLLIPKKVTKENLITLIRFTLRRRRKKIKREFFFTHEKKT